MNSQEQPQTRPGRCRLITAMLLVAALGLAGCSTTSSSNSPIRWPWKRERAVPPAPPTYGNNRPAATPGSDPFLPSPMRPAADQQPAAPSRDNASLAAPIPVEAPHPS